MQAVRALDHPGRPPAGARIEVRLTPAVDGPDTANQNPLRGRGPSYDTWTPMHSPMVESSD